MKRRQFVKSSVIGTSAVSSGFLAVGRLKAEDSRMVYEIRKYELTRRNRQKELDKYFEQALIPALNRQGCNNVGSFTPVGKAEPTIIYLLIPYSSPSAYFQVATSLWHDTEFREASAFYDKLPAENPVIKRYTGSLLLAFEGFPTLNAAAEKKHLFELRTYEGYNEDAVRRKIAMFNNGEIDVFLQNKFTPVFYGEDLTGNHLPCLTYMLAYNDMDERDRRWKDFGSDPVWQRMKSDPAYANTVSNIIKVFLEPLPYSQI